jgi:hypothetical protein
LFRFGVSRGNGFGRGGGHFSLGIVDRDDKVLLNQPTSDPVETVQPYLREASFLGPVQSLAHKPVLVVQRWSRNTYTGCISPVFSLE